jgi:tRNA threonylcarbamoyladenosine biosynthesis protein TsaB
MLTEMLAAQSLSLDDLKEIEVHPGPGSYTGLRVGFTIANALGYLLGIPVNGKTMADPAVPVYE